MGSDFYKLQDQTIRLLLFQKPYYDQDFSAKKIPTNGQPSIEEKKDIVPLSKSFNYESHLRHTHKVVPSSTFPHDTKRIFADFRHKLGVPSADTYYKEDHQRRGTNRQYGISFHAEKHSDFRKVTGPKMKTQPPRFDPYVDRDDSKKPGPASYTPGNIVHRTVKSYSSSKTERMKATRYNTDAPGAGTYRHQSEFGVYNANDINNTFNMVDGFRMRNLANSSRFQTQTGFYGSFRPPFYAS